MKKNARIKLNPKGLEQLSRDLGEQIAKEGIQVTCPRCNEPVMAYGNSATCPSCHNDFEVVIRLE